MGLPVNKKYKASNVGGLMIDDAIRVFNYLANTDLTDFLDTQIQQILPIKTESSRRRIFQELLRRFLQMDKLVVDYFVQAERKEQIVILYYSVLKSYQLLFDVVFQVLIPKYGRGDKMLTQMDVFAFLDSKVLEQPQIEKWGIRTRKNMAGIVLMMLKEVGIQQKQQIMPLNGSKELWHIFVKSNEFWMLDAVLLTNDDKQRIINL
jgi:hypothetical protein